MKKVVMSLALSIALGGCTGSSDNTGDDAALIISNKAQLGKQLYFDKNLSLNRTQSCATCHNPEQGFIDERINDASVNGIAAAGSLGDNGTSIGDRNAPTAAYAAFSPDFKQDRRSRVASQQNVEDYVGFMGGQFWDGREVDLTGQAGGPPTNPSEMGMPDKASVVDRIKENNVYVTAFESLYGTSIFNDVALAYTAMAESIAAFETTKDFFPFDSKYDKSLMQPSEYTYSPISAAAHGKALFFSSDLSCAACHQLRPLGDKGEIFTSFEYHNIGVPENTALRVFNGVTVIDQGLLNNPAVSDVREKGKFKVPTLRNTAVTAPYMHNGVFNELETVIKFYEHARLRAHNLSSSQNPETNLPWRTAEISENIEHDLLGKNDQVLGDAEVKALVCFFMTLTDARYEHVLDQNKVTECGI